MMIAEKAISIYKKTYKVDVIDEETLSNATFETMLENILRDNNINEEDDDFDELEVVNIVQDMLRTYQYGDTSDADDISLIEEDLSNRYVSNL